MDCRKWASEWARWHCEYAQKGLPTCLEIERGVAECDSCALVDDFVLEWEDTNGYTPALNAIATLAEAIRRSAMRTDQDVYTSLADVEQLASKIKLLAEPGD